MKIAIRGHKSRGKEVIQILESLGGINRMNHSGRFTKYFYYISGDDNTIAWTEVRPEHLNVFTLEEFEKEFPYKIGETVITTLNHVGTIIGIVNGKYKVLFREDSALIVPHRLKLYKEMKEERNITLALDKAKEWYKKGGELKEVALQAYSEEELNKVELPKTWKEFCASNPIKVGEAFISSNSVVRVADFTADRNSLFDKQICPSGESASAHLAMIQLEQLRDCWRQSWKPDWNDANQKKYCICYHQGKFKISMLYETRHFLSFPTQEMAEDFLKCFKYLIEKAGDLI